MLLAFKTVALIILVQLAVLEAGQKQPAMHWRCYPRLSVFPHEPPPPLPPPPPVQVHVNPAWTHSFSTSVSEHNNTLAPSQLLMTPITLIYSRLTASARALRTKCWTLSFGPAVVPVLYNMGLQLLKLAPSVSRRPPSWCYWGTCSSETIRPVDPYLFLSKTVKDSVQVWNIDVPEWQLFYTWF